MVAVSIYITAMSTVKEEKAYKVPFGLQLEEGGMKLDLAFLKKFWGDEESRTTAHHDQRRHNLPPDVWETLYMRHHGELGDNTLGKLIRRLEADDINALGPDIVGMYKRNKLNRLVAELEANPKIQQDQPVATFLGSLERAYVNCTESDGRQRFTVDLHTTASNPGEIARMLSNRLSSLASADVDVRSTLDSFPPDSLTAVNNKIHLLERMRQNLK